MRNLTSRPRLLLAITVIVFAVAIAGLGVYADFTSSTTAVTHNFSTGSLSVDVGQSGTQANRLDVDATDVSPGETVERSLDLINSGSIDLSAITLTTTATSSSILDTDTTDGIQLQIDRCSTDWDESGSAPDYTYSCSGSTDSVLASRPIIGSGLTLDNLSALSGGHTDHLLVSMTLPSSADNSFENQSSAIRFVFTSVH
jgi:hypothetical protein